MAGALLSFALATPTAAQPKQPTTYDRAIAAGYKALFLCSGMFVAGRTRAQIEAEELRGIYPEYEAIVPTLEANIQQERFWGVASVTYDPAAPPRTAEYSWPEGCVIRPISGHPAAVRLSHPPRAGAKFGVQGQPWPAFEASSSKSVSPQLKAAVRIALHGGYGEHTTTTSIVLISEGQVLSEEYGAGFGPDTPQRTWSVAKSMAGTLVGIAALQSGIDPAKLAPVPEWQRPGDPRRAITIDNLLRMASGLHSDTAGNRTDDIYFGGTAVTEQAPFWPLIAKPGNRFRYANNDTLLAIRALRSVLGEERYRDFPRAALFDRIGMTRTVAEKDWQGNFILSSQVWSTARDLARFGLLYLNDGVWNGERILPEGWVKYVTNPSGPQPESGPRYGATFWLFGPQQGLPAGTYAAQGNRGQYVMIVPSKQLVVVRQGLDPHGTRFDIARFTADVIAALDQGA